MQNEVIFSEDNGVGIITLNRPDRLNALTYSMVDLINQNLSFWETNNNINMAEFVKSEDFHKYSEY